MSDPAPPLRIYLCGQLALERGAAVVREAEFPARQGRLAWAYLVLHRKGHVGRDELADAIWGDDLPDRWDSTINGVVSRLRTMLRRVCRAEGEVAIHGEVGRYRLRLPAGTIIDWERARDAIHAADTGQRQAAYDAVLAEARVALEIAARGFLVGEEAPWIVGQRRAMAAMQLHALTRTVEAELARGNAAIAEREARELLHVDPLWEAGYGLLMRALAAGVTAHKSSA